MKKGNWPSSPGQCIGRRNKWACFSYRGFSGMPKEVRKALQAASNHDRSQTYNQTITPLLREGIAS